MPRVELLWVELVTGGMEQVTDQVPHSSCQDCTDFFLNKHLFLCHYTLRTVLKDFKSIFFLTFTS
jgi:hypothetical protein